jgi:hypothetical protein
MGMMVDKTVTGGKRVFILLVLNIEIFLEFIIASWLLGSKIQVPEYPNHC